MRVQIEIVDDNTGTVLERITTDSFILAYDDGSEEFKVTGNLIKNMVLQKAGDVVGSFMRQLVNRRRA